MVITVPSFRGLCRGFLPSDPSKELSLGQDGEVLLFLANLQSEEKSHKMSQR